ncbi:CdaR family protein [Clostridium cellulovorans]|uniref:YbbR family protein n=1 Tax=Clostridium cellulovorans (strain ATCC 35296 / DSM 3052 / OCM 3 / 743B) TaxID=573061 RepID=D9SX44_CLOC7|nr:CdaR family protein [Clostridium cellulovorans]ADL53347.1 YbbR family protein [Clostridium cellulovorans 743B]
MEEKNTPSTIIKIFSFIAAFILWIYISTIYNPIKTVIIANVPVEIKNSEGLKEVSLILMPKQTFKVNITIKGNANIIYGIKPSNFKLEVDLSKYAIRKGDTKIPVEIIEAPKDVTILKESGIWVDIDVDNLAKKSLPIDVELSGEPRSGVVFGQTKVTPSEITLTGPESYVNQVKNLSISCTYENFQEQDSLQLPIEALDANGNRVTEISLSQAFATVELPYNNIKNVPVNIKTLGVVGEDIIIKSIEADIQSVDISASDDVLANISSIDTEAIDLATINSNKTIETKLVIPNNVELISATKGAKVKITVQKIISKSINLNIALKNLGSQLKGDLSEVKANVVVKGVENIINELSADNFNCYVDCKDLVEGEYELKVNVSVNKSASIVAVNPENVKVTISK